MSILPKSIVKPVHKHQQNNQRDEQNRLHRHRQRAHPDADRHELDQKHRKWSMWAGKLGFFAKALVYGLIGGMAIHVAKGGEEDISPQGSFLILGNNGVIGIPVLIIMAVCLVMYALWRFSEAATGQGSDATFSKTKNIFKYRVSPAVSGLVYIAYTYYVIRTIFTPREERAPSGGSQTTQSKFPDSWSKQGGWGKFGVAFIGFTFLIATLTQLIVFFTGSFKQDLYKKKLRNKWFRWFVFTIGHIGFFARGMVFLLVAIMMFRSLTVPTGSNSTVTDKATEILLEETWGKVLLILLGVGLLLYSLFALLNIHLKIFPTPPPSRIAELSGDDDHDNHGVGNGQHKQKEGFLEKLKIKRSMGRSPQGSHETLRV
ncbi:hypothetical protein HK097_004793 [Rhizophlyctis rosea]|uniref:DUF1206 domain-containing protein n=1 Tax=Rhizophlyctis rosea TaxID=64517 RepID=A0AAD5S2I3_9FUNG|nr:hypothetical protein HK097_004793 [Rhizophlyctis rosea]